MTAKKLQIIRSVESEVRERFWKKVEKPTNRGCWLWRAAKFDNGYGAFRYAGQNRKAHRIAFALEKGPVPQGTIVLHSCDTPACVNPVHLRLGTGKDNALDRVVRGRGAYGSRSGTAKLTEHKVREIRRLYAQGNITNDELAQRFGVSPSTMAYVTSNHYWRHVL